MKNEEKKTEPIPVIRNGKVISNEDMKVLKKSRIKTFIRKGSIGDR